MIGLLALLLIAIVPMALAEVSVDASVDVNAQTGDTETTATTDANASTDAQMTPRDRMKERMRTGGAMTENRAVVKDVRAANAETRVALKAERAELRALGEELKACKGKRDDTCEKKRADAKVEVKASLIKAADEVIELLGKTKTRLADSNVSTKAELTAQIDAQITLVTEAKAKAEALNENSTRAEVKAASAELRKAIVSARKSLRIGAHLVVAARFGGVIKMTEQLELRLERALEHLKSKGVDVSSVNTATFEAKLDAAKASHQAAVDLFVQAKTDEGKSADLMKQATEKMREAHASLKEAQAELRSVLKALKDVQGGSEALAQASTDASAEASASAQ